MTFRTRIALTASGLAASVLVAAFAVFGGGLHGHAIAAETGSSADASGVPKEYRGVATFGSGCFWCTESDFDKVDGVLSTTSGYMGGTTKNPTYKEVSTGKTGHIEVLQVTFDKRKVDYPALLERYWRTTDIVDGGGQFCDRGNQYAPVIFAHSDRQFDLARQGKERLENSGRFDREIAVAIRKAETFTAAETYHQDYYKKNPVRYRFYRWNCGRDQRLEELWGKPATN